MSLQHSLAWLDRHINLEATAGKVEGLSLEKMRSLVKVLGDPHLDVPVVHVTGTNGKGSTSAMITALLGAAGLSVGTYGSPHVSQINERIQRNGEPIADDELAEVLTDLERVEDHLDHAPSWFELMTAAAYRWFADLAVDVAVVEVGKLGRYDATNVVEAPVAVLTNVGYDHTDGGVGWRRKVAHEKAGIVTPGGTLCLGEVDPRLADIFEAEGAGTILRRHQDFGCLENRLAVGGRLVDLRTPAHDLHDVFVSLHGAHQGHNAAIALTAAEAFLGTGIAGDLVSEAFGSLSLPGRFEVLAREPLLVLDGAHNPDGAAAAVTTFDEGFAAGGRRVLLVGLLSERDPVQMLEAFDAARFDQVVCATPPSPRAMPAATLAAAAAGLGIDADVVAAPADAIDHVLFEADGNDAILVAGSLYLVGAARDEVLARQA